MDRRSLIITGAALGLSEFGAGLSAQAQTELPPARPRSQAASSAPTYQAPSASRYSDPSTSYQGAPSEDGYSPPSNNPAAQPGYRDPPAYPPSRDDYQTQRPYGGPAAQPLAPPTSASPTYPASTRAQTYSHDELVNSVSDFMGVTAESAGAAIESIFRQNGRPTGYIAGEELSGAFVAGLRYGKGLLYMKNRPRQQTFWQGPSIGFDWGGNGSRVFTLCYNLQYPDAVFRRFPGVEGSAYLVGGLGVNYQRAEDITLAPIRAGVGLRLGANVGYLSYSRRRNWIPF